MEEKLDAEEFAKLDGTADEAGWLLITGLTEFAALLPLGLLGVNEFDPPPPPQANNDKQKNESINRWQKAFTSDMNPCLSNRTIHYTLTITPNKR